MSEVSLQTNNGKAKLEINVKSVGLPALLTEKRDQHFHANLTFN